MSCNIEHFKQEKEAEALSLIYNDNAKSYSLFPKKNPTSVVIKPSNASKIKNLDQAYRAAQGMERKIAKEYGEDYNFKVFGKWTNIIRGVDSVRVEVNIPSRLVSAYKKKQQLEEQRNFQRDLDYFNGDRSLMEQEMGFDMPQTNQPPNELNIPNYISYKESLLERAEESIANMKSIRIHNKSKELNRKIKSAELIKSKLEKDIKALKNPDNIFEKMVSFISEDMTMIDRLLEQGGIDNLHTAEKMISFYSEVADYSNTGNNPLINTSQEIGEREKEVLERIATEVAKRKKTLLDSKQGYLQELIDNSSHIQKLFPDMEVQELLKDISDINVFDLLLTVDKRYVGNDSLLAQLMRIELERSRSKNKSFVADIVARMDAVLPKVKNKLPKIVSVPYWFGKSITENSWDLFYQKTSRGNKTGRIIDKFSTSWYENLSKGYYKLDRDYREAVAEKDHTKANRLLQKKYQWLNLHTDIIDVTQLPEIISNTENLIYLEDVDTSTANSYKQELIDKIGQRYYDKIVEEQQELIEDYRDFSENYIDSQLLNYGVSTFEELPEPVQNSIKITLKTNNPFEFVKSHKSGQEGRVDFENGNSSNQFQSKMKYIKYIPKENVLAFDNSTGEVIETDSGYYDSDFKQIENDQDLYEFWKILEEATTYMNMSLADAEKFLVHGSILSMKKSFWDILIDPSSGIGGKVILLSNSLMDSLKSMISSRTGRRVGNDFESINKQQFKTNEEQISKRFRTITLKLENKIGQLPQLIEVSNIPTDAISLLQEEFSSNLTRQYISDNFGKKVNLSRVIREMITDQVVSEQTFNLPVLLRAYLEMTAEYKAQKESQPQLSIYKQFYEGIKRENTNKGKVSSLVTKAMDSITDFDSLKRNRVLANKRLNHWYNSNVLGQNDSHDWLNIGKKVYETEEVKLKKQLEERLKDPNLTDAERTALQEEINELGANIVLSEIYNTVVNKFQIWKGLAYSVKSNVINRFQGWFQGQVNDTGKYWTTGNFFIANRFISRKGLRYAPGQSKYKEEIEKTRLLMNKLNIIQDATNEIDRARNDSGLTGVAKKVQPFYFTEYTEWHNQTPQILSMLMDMEITDKNGDTYKIFNGSELIPYTINDGVLELREEFRTPDNIATWEDFSSTESADNKIKMSEVIGLINGDYSRTGNTYVKKTAIGKTIMMFKTWMPNSFYNRFAKGQTSLALGKKELNGMYTSHRASTLSMSLGLGGLLMAGPGMAVGLGLVGAGIGAYISKSMNRKDSILEDLTDVKAMATIGKGIAMRMIGIPVNGLTGKNIIKQQELGNLGITEEDAQNLRSIMSEMATLLSFVLIKVMIKSLLGDNDEEEPKTTNGSQKSPNPYYPGKIRSEREKMMHNVMENEITRIIGDIQLYINPAALKESVYDRNAITTIFDDVNKLFTAYSKWNQGLDKIQTGPNVGESRMWNQTKKTFLPGIMQHPLTIGFEKSMEQEYDKSEYFDTFFNSDYKKDKKETRMNRTVVKEELTSELQKAYGYDNLSPEEKLMIDPFIEKEVRKQMKYISPYPNRLEYDENQDRID